VELSVFDLFRIGIGPSSSHTVGPMRAAKLLTGKLRKHGLFARVAQIQVELFGSLGATGRGHRTDRAVVWGLLGEEPETIEPAQQDALFEEVVASGDLLLDRERRIAFVPDRDIILRGDQNLPLHPNGMRFRALDGSGGILYTKDFYSIGGGFVVGRKTAEADRLVPGAEVVPHPYRSGAELLAVARGLGLTIAEVVLANETARRPVDDVRAGLDRVWRTMGECVERGFVNRGVLPGRLRVERRAPDLYETLQRQSEGAQADPLGVLDWVALYALAVNEENAVGGRVVTAPTNGAAGVVPAVLRYYERFVRGSGRDGVHAFLLTAGAVGLLYKVNASISGAEVGCQGEVGVACSMAAAGLTEALGGSVEQVENAAEIGMEHNLGLTCDPVDGLVQIPCIERNAMAAVKAVNASRIALRGSGKHYVSLDQVMATMRQTGLDMRSQYKETATGGLATHITEC
jgi:L-serine dehydratase